MSATAIPTENSAPVSAASVAFLAELARLPAVQKGEFKTVAELVCRRCLDLVDARYVTVWMLDADRKFLRSIVRYDGLTGRQCPEIAIPSEQIVDELAALHGSAQIVSDNALTDPRLTGAHDGYLKEYDIAALLEHVIRVSGEDVGIFSFERVGPLRAWHPSDSALARGVCSYLALTSVNQQKSALEQRSASTAALQTAILHNAAYAVIATDPNGTITFFNRAAEQMLGYRADEIVNKATPALFHDAAEVAYRAAILTTQFNREIEPGFGVFVAKTLAGLPNEDEWIYVRRDGSRMTVLVSTTAIRAANGEVEGFLGIASDITERNRIAHRLRQSEEMLSRVLLQSPDAILITALSDGRILEVNPGFEQITGYTRAEALGHTTIDLSLWVDLVERNAMIQQVRTSGEVKSMPVQISRRGGDRRQCILWGRTFEFAGVDALLTSVQDVTDIKEAAQAARELATHAAVRARYNPLTRILEGSGFGLSRLQSPIRDRCRSCRSSGYCRQDRFRSRLARWRHGHDRR
ncbi:MAG: PAS domain S-box protein [Rhodospirillaceae bacterium]|nr:PAS domain S-box protein [Rhodospirillaceae bacterium]